MYDKWKHERFVSFNNLWSEKSLRLLLKIFFFSKKNVLFPQRIKMFLRLSSYWPLDNRSLLLSRKYSREAREKWYYGHSVSGCVENILLSCSQDRKIPSFATMQNIFLPSRYATRCVICSYFSYCLFRKAIKWPQNFYDLYLLHRDQAIYYNIRIKWIIM